MSNRYSYSVPFSAEELHADYVESVMTQAEVGRKWGVSQKVVWRALQRMGIPTRRAVARNQHMSANNNWRGGRHLLPAVAHYGPYADQGYVAIYRPHHPHARKNGYVAEHIVVALECSGADRIASGECVHHINLQKSDNAPDNLAICTYKDHQRYHSQLEELAVKLLLETGQIRFQVGVGYVET